MRFIFARHGQSVSNADPSYVGHDAPLTEIGVQQAHRLGQWLKANESEIDLVVSSPLQRARHTAQIVNEYLQVASEVHDDLEEMRDAVLGSLPQRSHPLQAASEFRAPDSTTYYDTYRVQVKRALDYLTVDPHRPKPILVVSHGGTMATLLRLIMERHDLRVHANNTGIMDVSWVEGKWHFWSINFTRHLPDHLLT
jgi:broad specificity phosphatase PhoE